MYLETFSTFETTENALLKCLILKAVIKEPLLI